MGIPAGSTWLITGVSSGFGRALAELALAHGERVVGTVRSEQDGAAFAALCPGHAIARWLDVADEAADEAMVSGVEREIGPIDILVNNAGYGYEGPFEECSPDDLHRQFAVNVFGPAALMRAALPFMRARGHGRIVNITSVGGLVAFPGTSLYHASKFALEGLSEAVAQEVRSLGIFVTAVAPGSFRTNWAGRSLVRAPRTIPAYDVLFDPLRAKRMAKSGTERGDPGKAALAILRLVEDPDPPVHLVLGADALAHLRRKRETLDGELARWEEVSTSTGFDEDAADVTDPPAG